jgi:2,4-dienoyl-CoA reductase-like NADH-dependent reductase (Old Yellow Enzyme family)
MSKLFEPISVRNLTTRNRIWIPPMCQYSCEEQDGVVGNWALVHYTSFAKGGAGLIIAEASGVSDIGRISPWCAGIWNDEHTIAWEAVVDSVHLNGGKIGIQLAHAGRKGSTHREWSGSGSVDVREGGWETVAPSAIAFEGYEVPRALEMSELDEIKAQFVAAANRAVTAGFDLIELHAAHGYLLHQFLSPLSNQRTDIYGGSLENRARLLIEIVIAVRAAIGDDLPLAVRFSATDWIEGGWTEEDTATVTQWCLDAGADLFDISSAGLSTAQKLTLGPGYQVPFAEYVGSRVDAPVSAVGSITSGTQAEEILQHGIVDVVMVGRAALGDPFWPIRAAQELGETIEYVPKRYKRAIF